MRVEGEGGLIGACDPTLRPISRLQALRRSGRRLMPSCRQLHCNELNYTVLHCIDCIVLHCIARRSGRRSMPSCRPRTPARSRSWRRTTFDGAATTRTFPRPTAASARSASGTRRCRPRRRPRHFVVLFDMILPRTQRYSHGSHGFQTTDDGHDHRHHRLALLLGCRRSGIDFSMIDFILFHRCVPPSPPSVQGLRHCFGPSLWDT